MERSGFVWACVVVMAVLVGCSESTGAGGSGGSGGSGGLGGMAGTGGMGGAPNTGGTGGGGGSAGAGGIAGHGGATGRCPPDLDGNGVVDGSETLVSNHAFDADLADWASIADIAWDDGDPYCGGYLRVTATVPGPVPYGRRGEAYQCIAISDNTVDYRLAFAYFLPPGQATLDGVFARVGFYTSPDCAGGTLDGAVELPRTGRWNVEGSWEIVDVGALEPGPPDQSVLIELGVRDTDQADEEPPVTAHFDEVLLRTE